MSSSLGHTARWLRYRLPARYVRRNQQPLCIGQKQRWFLLRLQARAGEFDFGRTDEPEFDQWRWAAYWEPVREVIYFKRPVYLRALLSSRPSPFPTGRRRCRSGGTRPRVAAPPGAGGGRAGRTHLHAHEDWTTGPGDPAARAPAADDPDRRARRPRAVRPVRRPTSSAATTPATTRQAVAQERAELESADRAPEDTNRELRSASWPSWTRSASATRARTGSVAHHRRPAGAGGAADAGAGVLPRRGREGAPASGCKIGQCVSRPASRPGHFLVHVSLVRAGKTDGMTSGNVSLTVDGQGPTASRVTLDCRADRGRPGRCCPINFRYYQDLDQDVTLPPGFKPEQLRCEVQLRAARTSPLSPRPSCGARIAAP